MSTKAHPFTDFKVVLIDRIPTGGMTIKLKIRHGSGGIIDKTLTVPEGSGPVKDENGSIVAASIPAGLTSAISSLDSAVASMISTAEGAGKFDVVPR